MKFSDIQDNESIYLYCGNLNQNRIVLSQIPFKGISSFRNDSSHIHADITEPFDLYDATVDVIQSEDVFNNIGYGIVPNILEEMYRVLKPEGYLRLSVPDYRCDVYSKDLHNNTHVWFPTYDLIKQLVEDSSFQHSVFYHYYDEYNKPVMRDIVYTKGWIVHTPDHDKRVQKPRRPMSIVVDCFKEPISKKTRQSLRNPS